MKKPRPKKRKTQHDKFVEAARALGASEDEREFEAKLRRIATVKSGKDPTTAPKRTRR